VSGHRRLARGERLVVATHNAGKQREIAALMAPHGIAVVSAGELGLPEPAETGHMFAENAAIKAVAAAAAAHLPALADDSGLCVLSLDGAPGLFSADWAGPGKDFRPAMARVWRELARRGAQDFTAWFVSALVLAWPDGHQELFEGRVRGSLVWPPRGTHGFGYDPMFVPDGQTQTFGEITQDEKQSLSHRARAFAALAQACLPSP
jgi:XTP/dITP diphosphohydrolase